MLNQSTTSHADLTYLAHLLVGLPSQAHSLVFISPPFHLVSCQTEPYQGEGSGDTILNSWACGSAVICSVGLQIGLC